MSLVYFLRGKAELRLTPLNVMRSLQCPNVLCYIIIRDSQGSVLLETLKFICNAGLSLKVLCIVEFVSYGFGSAGIKRRLI